MSGGCKMARWLAKFMPLRYSSWIGLGSDKYQVSNVFIEHLNISRFIKAKSNYRPSESLPKVEQSSSGHNPTATVKSLHATYDERIS
jgi:hypothetical protein